MIESLATAPPGPHPTPDDLYRARHEPSSSWSGSILAHAARCASCSEELLRQEAFDTPEALPEIQLEAAWSRFLAADSAPERNAPQASNVVPLSRPIRRERRPALLLLAATLTACVVGLSLWKVGQHSSSFSGPSVAPTQAPAPLPAPIPAPAGGETTRGGLEGEDEGSPVGVIPAPPAEFVFEAEDGPLHVTVYDGPRTYSWTSEPTLTGRIPFPPAERAKLQPGIPYYWTVLSGSTPPANETARSFRIELPHP